MNPLVLNSMSFTQHACSSLSLHVQVPYSYVCLSTHTGKLLISFCLISPWAFQLPVYIMSLLFMKLIKRKRIHVCHRAPNTVPGASPAPTFRVALCPTHQPPRRRRRCCRCSASAWAGQPHSRPRSWGSWPPCCHARDGRHHERVAEERRWCGWEWACLVLLQEMAVLRDTMWGWYLPSLVPLYFLEAPWWPLEQGPEGREEKQPHPWAVQFWQQIVPQRSCSPWCQQGSVPRLLQVLGSEIPPVGSWR